MGVCGRGRGRGLGGLGRGRSYGWCGRDERRIGGRECELRLAGRRIGGGKRDLPRRDDGGRNARGEFLRGRGMEDDQEHGGTIKGDRCRNDPPQDGVEHGMPPRGRNGIRHRRNYTRRTGRPDMD
jgi:hypothetical protein